MRRTADTAAQRSTGVSFIVPVYNKAPWLPRVLDQIAAQRGNFEREYIFVDDGSTDGSVQILRERTAEWPGVTIIEQANHGPAHATNRGIERAKMPFIKFCDADDLLADDATVTLLRALLEHPDAVLAFGEAEIYDDGWKIDLTTDLRYATATTIHSPVAFALRNNPYIPAQVLMRSELVCASGGCDVPAWLGSFARASPLRGRPRLRRFGFAAFGFGAGFSRASTASIGSRPAPLHACCAPRSRWNHKPRP